MKAEIILTTLATAVVLAGCWGNNSKKAQEGEAADVAVAGDNTIELFNGQNFEGWRGYNLEGMPASGRWIIEDGAMKIVGNGRGEGDDNIIYGTKFKNFKLTFDYKVSKGGCLIAR